MPGVNFCPADDIVIGLRMIKSKNEQKLLEKGALIADRTMDVLRDFIVEGKTEMEVATKIITAMKGFGADQGDATCQSGVERSNEPLMRPLYSERKLRKGDMLHFEIRGSYGGYLIDTCRSTVIGSPSRRQKDILETIVEAMNSAIETIKPGVRAECIEEVAAKVVEEHGFGQGHFTVPYGGPGTYLAHCIGVCTPEPPFMAKGDKTILEPGMGPVTVEPGLYRTNVGGARIEDEVFVTDNGNRLLNHYDRVWW
jgi:Xaa-Pro aminopeptidase